MTALQHIQPFSSLSYLPATHTQRHINIALRRHYIFYIIDRIETNIMTYKDTPAFISLFMPLAYIYITGMSIFSRPYISHVQCVFPLSLGASPLLSLCNNTERRWFVCSRHTFHISRSLLSRASLSQYISQPFVSLTWWIWHHCHYSTTTLLEMLTSSSFSHTIDVFPFSVWASFPLPLLAEMPFPKCFLLLSFSYISLIIIYGFKDINILYIT